MPGRCDASTKAKAIRPRPENILCSATPAAGSQLAVARNEGVVVVARSGRAGGTRRRDRSPRPEWTDRPLLVASAPTMPGRPSCGQRIAAVARAVWHAATIMGEA